MMLPLALFVLVCTLGHAMSEVAAPPQDPAQAARYIVNQADWASVATISTRDDGLGYPAVNLISLSDGPVGHGTGVPYLFMTPLDFTAKDLEVDNRASILVTLAQGDYCKEKNYNAMDPRCARAMITGKIVKINPKDKEIAVAKTAMFSRHPWLAHLPENHHFFFAKLEIETIALYIITGGHKFVTPEQYYKAASH